MMITENGNYSDFTNEIKNNNWNIHGMRVRKDNQIIFQYGECEERFPIYSATKSITALGVGLAVSEGKMKIEDSLYQYIAKIVPKTISEEKIETLKKITIKRLLTMSIPELPFRPQGEDWLEYAINSLPQNIENIAFEYSNIPAYLAGVALEQAIGEPVMDYLNVRLFQPLKIEKSTFINCPSGYFYGASGMELSVNELEKIGQLCMNYGWIGHQEIIPEVWVNEATKKQIDCREGGYGYYFWKYGDGYRISGKWGQRCIVFPEEKLLITYLSETKENSDEIMEEIRRIFELGSK